MHYCVLGCGRDSRCGTVGWYGTVESNSKANPTKPSIWTDCLGLTINNWRASKTASTASLWQVKPKIRRRACWLVSYLGIRSHSKLMKRVLSVVRIRQGNDSSVRITDGAWCHVDSVFLPVSISPSNSLNFVIFSCISLDCRRWTNKSRTEIYQFNEYSSCNSSSLHTSHATPAVRERYCSARWTVIHPSLGHLPPASCGMRKPLSR